MCHVFLIFVNPKVIPMPLAIPSTMSVNVLLRIAITYPLHRDVRIYSLQSIAMSIIYMMQIMI